MTQLASSTLRNASKSKNEKQEVLASTINEKTHEEYDFYTYPRRMLGETGFGLIRQHRMKSGGEEISKNMNKSEIEAMQETLVKLKFPKESANPWTKLSRLIPVLEFNKEIVSQSGDMVPVSVDDNAGSMPLAGAPPIQPGTIAERATKNVLHLQTDMPVHSSDETPAGMVKLCKGVHVAVHYVAPDSPASGSHYEVDKLRGKRLRRFQGKEAKGLKTDREDPWVRKYIQSKGSPKKGEVLVAEYLVHWRQVGASM